ncbi:hypothetical protein D3C71_2162800 [compost metagenome]
MIEQIPLIFKLDNRMVGGPSDDRSKDCPFEGERSKRTLADAVDKLVGSSG